MATCRLNVDSDTQLARILGVTRQAVYKAEADGRIARCDDATWDVLDVVMAWRQNTWGSLQRRSGVIRPWLDVGTPLTPDVVAELERRARAEGTVEE